MNAYSSSSLLLLKGLGSLITHSFLWEQFLTYLAIVHKAICYEHRVGLQLLSAMV